MVLGHGGVAAVVRDVENDGVARAAIGAVGEGVAVAAIGGVGEIGGAFRTGGDVGGDQGELAGAIDGVADGEFEITCRREVSELGMLNPREGWGSLGDFVEEDFY